MGFNSYWGKTSPPYIYEGSWPIEEKTIESIITFYFLSSQHLFQPPYFSSLDLHDLRWRPRGLLVDLGHAGDAHALTGSLPGESLDGLC
jgi:hypothetical protein